MPVGQKLVDEPEINLLQMAVHFIAHAKVAPAY
jgi:hypothetical protein